MGAKFIQASTSEIYGESRSTSVGEEQCDGYIRPIGERACYAEGKRLAETLCDIYSEILNVWVVRIFNTYGPGMNPEDGRLIPELFTNYLKGTQPTIYGNSLRSWMFIDDLVDGLMEIVNDNYDKPNLEVINLGNPDAKYRSREMVEMIYYRTVENGQGAEFKQMSSKPDEPQYRVPDITKAKVRLGWSPKVSISEGLQKTLEYFKKKLGVE